jgi:hypothetical protein
MFKQLRFTKDLSFLKWIRKRPRSLSRQSDAPGVITASIDRNEFFGMIDGSKSILEIGKLTSPVFKQSKNIDVFNRVELIEHYQGDSTIDPDKIGDVDYVVKNNDWTCIHERFDYLVTSHNIEHVPCLIHFFHNAGHVLQDNGKIYAAIPDYRYCFDTDKIPSTILDVLEARYLRRDKPGMRDVIEHMLLHHSNNDPSFHWSKGSYRLTAKKYFELEPHRLKRVMQNDFSRYFDVHCWKFTPESFSYIINTLYEMGETNFKVSKVFVTKMNTYEFFVIMEKSKLLQ